MAVDFNTHPAAGPDRDALKRRSDSFQRQADFYLHGIVRPHLLDFILIAVLAVVFLVVRRDLRVANDAIFVAASPGIAAFHPIEPSDVAAECKKRTPLRADLTSKVSGYYSANFLPHCALIDRKKLSSLPLPPSAMKGRILLRLKAQPTSLYAGMRPPFAVTLLFAPHEQGAAPLVLDNVLLLDFQTGSDGVSITAAILAADQAALASFAARSDVYIASAPR